MSLITTDFVGFPDRLEPAGLPAGFVWNPATGISEIETLGSRELWVFSRSSERRPSDRRMPCSRHGDIAPLVGRCLRFLWRTSCLTLLLKSKARPGFAYWCANQDAYCWKRRRCYARFVCQCGPSGGATVACRWRHNGVCWFPFHYRLRADFGGNEAMRGLDVRVLLALTRIDALLVPASEYE